MVERRYPLKLDELAQDVESQHIQIRCAINDAELRIQWLTELLSLDAILKELGEVPVQRWHSYGINIVDSPEVHYSVPCGYLTIDLFQDTLTITAERKLPGITEKHQVLKTFTSESVRDLYFTVSKEH